MLRPTSFTICVVCVWRRALIVVVSSRFDDTTLACGVILHYHTQQSCTQHCMHTHTTLSQHKIPKLRNSWLASPPHYSSVLACSFFPSAYCSTHARAGGSLRLTHTTRTHLHLHLHLHPPGNTRHRAFSPLRASPPSRPHGKVVFVTRW